MTDNENQLAELLLRWEELKEQGHEVSSAELCRDCSHLRVELDRRIQILAASDWLDQEIGEQVETKPHESELGQPRTLANRYRLDELIAEGGYAQVWRAYDLELHRNVAVKLPKSSRFMSADDFITEARRVAQLNHPNIVPVHDVGRDGQEVFIIAKFVVGGDLANLVRTTSIPIKRIVAWIAEIAGALEHAHDSGIVHRDIKPANILIDEQGRALLTDFGIAQAATDFDPSKASVGTLRYMPPEQLEAKAVDVRSDIYSLGLVLYELLTGTLPYKSDKPHAIRQEIVNGLKPQYGSLPSDLRRICQKALQLKPQERFQNAASLASALHRTLQKRRSTKAAVAIFAGFLSLLIFGFFIWRSYSTTVRPMPRHWIEQTAALAVDEQLKVVTAKLKELNPGFDGQVIANQADGSVNWIEMRTDHVRNISPLAAFKKLQFVNLSGTFDWKHNGMLEDLSSLKGLPIEEIDLHGNLVKDLSPLADAPLRVLVINNTKVTDLSPIRKSKLTKLDIHNSAVADLSPVAGMPIEILTISNTQVKDLTPITGMPIRDLRCQYCGLSNIEPLRGMPLHTLEAHGNPITDLSPLADSLVCNLNIYKTKITDWSPIRSMPCLRLFWFDFDPARDIEILRSVKTLESINERSAADFWRANTEPTNAPEAIAYGKWYFDASAYDAAIRYYTMAAEFDKANADIFLQRAECLLRCEAYAKSEEDLQRSLSIAPTNPVAHERLAYVQFCLHRFDDATASMQQALNLAQPNEVDRYKLLLAKFLSERATNLEHNKQYDEAVKVLDEAIELNPGSRQYQRQRERCVQLRLEKV